MTPDQIAHLVSRFIHISSVVLLIGGAAYARQVLVPALNTLPEELRVQTASFSQSRFRSAVYTLLAIIVLSGFYNFFTYAGPRHSQSYQIWFGIKMLLVAHVLATAILWTAAPYGDVVVDGKGKRRTASLAISGLAIIAISAYLRSLSLRGL